ncbi:HAMP domain-containing protein [Solirubrobacter sp. CPCC 204708]|uniref:histidine kinase n=1 Tax=Solirubrobacter deserti TaxID=2282478 RepID=A0ABT4RCP3_9ACTN|nr:HAMP domain-containing protein [Solirubrobacter deserti]MBE2315661.1 HAMP domain-containing protein [Solirubrobacter deserti]MDA0136301.1 HAMP domain-containing protein [Solirubrobacter deserti]
MASETKSEDGRRFSAADEKALEAIVVALTAARDGDFTVKLPARRRDVIGDVQARVNDLVAQNARVTKELQRLARVVGRDGRMAERATVPDSYGGWAEKIEAVNSLVDDLVRPTTEVGRVIAAVAQGDLSQKMALTIEGQPVKGEFSRIGQTVNAMVDQLGSFADEVTRVAREVGTDGKLGGQAEVKGVSGTWRDLTDSVNVMAANLTEQVRQIAQVTTAVANGDLTQQVTVDARGEVLELKRTINAMVARLSSFGDEVTRVAREVGTDGELGGQAQVADVSGTWKDLTESVNVMASNLTDQVRQIAQVTTAVANGDLTQKVTVEAKGEVAALAATINDMTDTLRTFASEVTGVAREVGTEGVLGGQAEVPSAAGTWRDLTDSVNVMAANLTDQVRQIAQVTTAVANGDLNQKVTVEAKGEVAALAETINSMTDTLRTFAEQVTGVAREVGTLGVLGGQADVPGVAGTWKDLTESVNSMATNLTDQVRNIAEVTTAVANGDLSRQITVDAQGEILELKRTINTMVDQLSSFADEVTRVAREVGTEGILGGQAEVKGVSGTWRGLTENVNQLANNLTSQVRNIAQVTTAVAQGDLSQKITVDAQGEILELKNTINTMVDQLSSFADEVTRVAREVGTEGQLGGQARVEGVSGTWRGLTDNVNLMAANLTDQVRNIAQVTTAVANGDLTQKISVDARGEVLELKETINTMVDQLRAFASEVTRVAREVGTEGKLGGQAEVEGISGTWRGLTENVNLMATNLTDQVRSIAGVTTAVARGDLTRKITVDAQGEILELKDTINTMVDQLSSFADEVTRVAREVGTEGKLGGQAEVQGVSGTWRGLTENVNQLADNLTSQVRNIAQVTTAVALGDLSQKITVDAQGEILELKRTINTMVDQLSSFADEVTRVAREVGTEGKLGGQAEVEGVSGTWRGLTESVNQLASNLTTQVRAMADVASSVTQGDLTRQITVEASGEVAELKDRVNQMIANLRDTTQQNAEQDWLKTNLARISGAMQGQRDLQTVSRMLMSEISPLVNAQHGAFFMVAEERLRLIASYGYNRRKNLSNEFHFGEGLPGQAALEMKSILVTNAPPDYVKVTSGLGEALPVNIMVLPILFEEQVLAVIELASINPFAEVNLSFLDQLSETIGVVLSTIIANNRTEDLLEEQRRLAQELQSQSEELQSQQDELKRSNTELEQQAKSLRASEELLQTQQEELRQTNEELQEKAALLAQQNRDIEVKNAEIERARLSLEERAEQLSLSSRYKSEFLANMSHELRTPLNSLLILSKLLSDNPAGNLTDQQVEFARTINQAGTDLLTLISDILDLTKVEAGKMEVNPAPLDTAEVLDGLERSFQPVAEEKGLELVIEAAADLPVVISDDQRVAQVLRNLLANAVKFTERGSVKLTLEPAREPYAVAFTVTDTGIGIPQDKLMLIFEAFQQADGTTSRRFGGTGLGLSISREIARLLGGEVRVSSTEGEGSSFTLFLPAELPAIAEPVELEPDAYEEPLPPAPEPAGQPEALPDDREQVSQGDRVALIADTDVDRATQRLDDARAAGFKGLVAMRPATTLALAQEHRPDVILLGLGAGEEPETLGRLKRDPRTRHLPVLVLADEGRRHDLLAHGAAGFLPHDAGPETLADALREASQLGGQRVRTVLVVDDDDTERGSIAALIGGEDVHVEGVASSEEALQRLDETRFDCIVLDLKLPKASGFALLERVKVDERHRNVPVIIHTGKALTRREETRLKRYAESIIVKDAGSAERLLDETTLALHRPPESLDAGSRRMLEQMRDADAALTGRKVLIVDDDVRNVFALTNALEMHGMQVSYAENGREALERLRTDTDVDLILMDIMMPELDGYQTMEAIRQMPAFERLPIIALTAKAMKGDREKSITAGASDYITKPVDVDQLVSLMRVWLYGDRD